MREFPNDCIVLSFSTFIVVIFCAAVTQSDSTTMELIIALSAVVGGAIVVLAFCLFCYR